MLFDRLPEFAAPACRSGRVRAASEVSPGKAASTGGRVINKVPVAIGMTPQVYDYMLEHTREPEVGGYQRGGREGRGGLAGRSRCWEALLTHACNLPGAAAAAGGDSGCTRVAHAGKRARAPERRVGQGHCFTCSLCIFVPYRAPGHSPLESMPWAASLTSTSAGLHFGIASLSVRKAQGEGRGRLSLLTWHSCAHASRLRRSKVRCWACWWS